MIQETIVTTQNLRAEPHIAPMGVHVADGGFLLLPYRPSATLANILATGVAVINCCDDVRVFAGCLTGRRAWPLKPAQAIAGQVLADTLAHTEVALARVDDDPVRPRLLLTPRLTVNHRPFAGFNRAQSAVVEAAILVSRLDRLPWRQVEDELAYLRIGFDKTAGWREREAWGWLMEAVARHRQQVSS